MKRNIVMSMAVSSLLLCGCNYNDRNFDGLDEASQPENIFKLDYTLTEADYATISDNKTNQKIAKEAGKDKALGYVKTDFYLSGDISAATYLPAFLADKYYTADDGSSVKVTYSYKENKSELLSDYSSIKIYTPSNKMYADIYGGNREFAPYLNGNTKDKVTDLLKGYKNPEEGDVVFLDYRLSKGTVDNDLLKLPLLWENFEGIATGKLTSLKDWFNDSNWFISSKGDAELKITSYDANQYVQISASKAKGACEAWLITPEIELPDTRDILSFDVNVGNWNADCLSVLISTDFDGSNVNSAGWTDITSEFTIPKKPAKGYGNFASAGKYALRAYNENKIRIAFKYVGDGANEKTTTYQIDNIMIGIHIPDKGGLNSQPVYALKVYNDKGEWENQNKNVYVLDYKDYVAMGVSSLNFTAEKPAVDYIPAYLASQVAYPLDGDVRVVAYRYMKDKEVKIYSDEYVYNSSASRWELNTRIVQQTDQFVYNEGAWKFDPSTIITLKEKDDATKEFYQYITDWVKENKGAEYVTSYGNNDYYYGGSAYNNNFDFRPASWKSQNAAAYGDKSNDDLKKLMFERLPEAFIPGLEHFYGDAAPVEGVNVIYTVNFMIYDGSTTTNWTIQYEVKEKGKFTYIEDSLKEVK